MFSKSEKYVIISGSLFLILLFISYEKFHQNYMKNRANFVKTQNEFISVSKAIQIILSEKEVEDLPKQMGSFLQWLDSFTDERQLLVEEHMAWFDPNSGALIDAWDEPVKLEVESETEYVFISSGPNKKFENGQGDDITYSFNPYEFKEKDK